MSQEKFKEALVKTEKLTKIDLENGSWEKLYLGAIEEVGEFCRAYSIENKFFGKAHKQLDEPATHEAVDVVICALSLFFYNHCDIKGVKPFDTIYKEVIEEIEKSEPKLHDVLGGIGHILSTINVYRPCYQIDGSSLETPPYSVNYILETWNLVRESIKLYILIGGEKEDFTDIMLKKLEKWENNHSKNK